MASLSHAPFASSNTQPLPSPKLLSSHLSMDPSASSSPLSTLSQPQLSSSSSANLSEQLNWLPKPISIKPPYHPMSPFNHPFAASTSPFYDAYSEAGDSIEQGFTGGDDPLLTSSWEALDKLVSASMNGSASATTTTTADQFSDFASLHAPHAPTSSTLQSASPSSLSDVDQKPLSAIYGSLQQKGINAWSHGNHANASTTTTPSNVGLNLASLISVDPGFVERAAKFSSYSQQINSQAYNSSLLQINKNSYINPISKADYNVDGACGVRKLINNNINAANHLTRSASSNVALQQHDDKYNIVNASINDSIINNSDKHSSPPQASMVNLSGSKKKREGFIKDGEVDDSGFNLGRKRAKGGEQEDQDVSNVNNKMSSKVHKSKAPSSEKTKQCGVSNSGESEQKSEVCNNNKTPSPSQSPPPPKPDFIHVRARRGQATDSHSLAERVRREKISERMKYLQDLVPGCTKVTGKAMMLDEIINYVQSLQRQVEFLSMKLAAVPPSKLEFNFESLFGKEVVQQPTLHNNCNASVLTPHLETSSPLPLNSSSFLQDNLQSLHHNPAFAESMIPSSVLHSLGADASLRRTLSMLAAASSDNFGECISQISDTWVDDDLQNFVPPLPGFRSLH